MCDLRKQNYSPRLNALLNWIEFDANVIDVGTDHAYLPIALLQLTENISGKIIAIDSNVEPLKRAAENIKKAGFDKKIILKLNDGLKNISLKGDETIVIAGLGGMLISQILEKAKHKFTCKNSFVLQPNWTWYELRKWLAANGFKIIKEKVVEDQRKYYSILSVQYTGEAYFITDTEAFLGINHSINEKSSDKNKEVFYRYLMRLQCIAKKKAMGIAFFQDIYKNISLILENFKNKYGGNFDYS